MPQSPTVTEARLKEISKAWKEIAPNEKFAGMTYAEFLLKIKPSTDLRDKIGGLETQISEAINQRDDADVQSLDVCAMVVNSVKGTPGYGADSPLYEAMGYVRKSERKSGLSRSGNNAAEQPKKAA